MSRYQYGADSSFGTYAASGTTYQVLPSTAVTFWTAQTGGSQITDLLNASMSPVTSVTSNADGTMPVYYGPDGVLTMWANGGGAERVLVTSLYGVASTLETVNTVAAAGTAQTLPDVTSATVHRLTLSASNCTLTFPTAAAGKSFTVVLVQPSSGGPDTVTWPGTVLWPGATAPTLTTTNSKRDVFSFMCADGTNWLGFIAGQNY